MGLRVPFIYHLALCSKVVEKKKWIKIQKIRDFSSSEMQKFDIKSCDKGEVSMVRVVEYCTSIIKVRVEILFKP